LFWLISGLLLLVISAVCVFTCGLIDPFQRNIIYFHVPVAVGSLIFFAVLFVFSILYLVKQDIKYDLLAASSGLVGFIFSILMNLSGMLFSRIEWNVWWTPSPRLISSAILGFLYFAYILLRASLHSEKKRSKIAAVFAIMAFIDVPIVFITARFIPDIHQPSFSFDNPWQYLTLVAAIAGINILGFVFIFFRTRVRV
jgi:heme exporter protein C